MRLIHVRTLSGQGTRPEQFRHRVVGVAIDPANGLFAVGDQHVKCFSPDGELQLQIPTPTQAWSIAVDRDSLWVGMRGTIEQFDLQGGSLTRIEDRDRLGRITGLAVRGDALLAADATHHTIHLYQASRWQRGVGRDVNTRGFMIPNGMLDLAQDIQNESVLVAHPQKHRVERYAWSGELIDQFGKFGPVDPGDFGGCCNPTHVGVVGDGLIAVSEKAPPRIKVFSPEGNFLTESSVDAFDPNTKNIDLAGDPQGRLLAIDPLRCTIEEFLLEPAGD